MNLFMSKELNSLEDLFLDQLGDLYDAEKRLVEALPLMADAATSPQLKAALTAHLGETKNQVARLEAIFSSLGRRPERETCEAMKGLIKEGNDILAMAGDPDVKDAAIIAACQRVEHYEISGYGTARTFAHRLGHHQAAELLQTTLDEEKNADLKLNQVAEMSVNVLAQQA